ncbi:MAG: glycosyltransferase family 4 protein [Kiritimatiellae bacterium]|nr:glycosyltransferase family 4 protein [Kiritimatiellia bacterium]MDW8459545.1 glycosyltransferase family 4 protein [Verrucomicrobiota bacterium]
MSNELASRPLRILTNQAYWQSPVWREKVDSIHPEHGRGLVREPPAWKQAWLMFRRRSHYDVVLTLGVRESMLYGLFCLLIGAESLQIMTEVFLDDERAGPVWHLKNRLYRRIARRALGVIANSRAEIDSISERYDIPRDRIRFVPINSTLADHPISHTDDGFILAAGRSHRDYPTLIAAVRSLKCRIVIICGRHDDIPAGEIPNATILRDVNYDIYLDHLRRCTLVAIPLRETRRATGQVVALEAMSLGKPVVATRVAGTVDYIQDGITGLLVPPGDVSAWHAALDRLLKDHALRERLAQEARAQIEARHSFDTHARLKLQAIRELFEKSRP